MGYINKQPEPNQAFIYIYIQYTLYTVYIYIYIVVPLSKIVETCKNILGLSAFSMPKLLRPLFPHLEDIGYVTKAVDCPMWSS